MPDDGVFPVLTQRTAMSFDFSQLRPLEPANWGIRVVRGWFDV